MSLLNQILIEPMEVSRPRFTEVMTRCLSTNLVPAFVEQMKNGTIFCPSAILPKTTNSSTDILFEVMRRKWTPNGIYYLLSNDERRRVLSIIHYRSLQKNE